MTTNFKLVIWDFDGTLAYRFGGLWAAALLEVISSDRPAFPATVDQLGPYLRAGFPWHKPEQPHPELRSARQWWDAMDPVFARAFSGVGLEPQLAWQMAKKVRRVYPDPERWHLFDDTLPSLHQLTKAGWHHVILSNHTPELASLVTHLSLSSHMLRVFGSAQTGYEKPHPQAFRNVLDAFPGASSIWMIGDSYLADIEGAQRAGIPGILVRQRHPEARVWRCSLTGIADVLNEDS